MATAGGEDTRRAERAGLKRKLTGAPRLLLGKASTGSEGEDPPENGDNKEEMENKTTAKCSAAAAQREAKPKEGSSVEGEAPPTGNWGCYRNRRRCRWWRRFFSELVCIRRQTKKFEKSSERHQNDGSVQPEGVLQKNEEKSEKKMFNKRAWPKFRKSRTSSDEQREEEQSDGSDHPLNVRKKLHRFFIRKKRPQEDRMAVAEVQTDAVQAVTATVETAVGPMQDGAATESLLEPTAGVMEEEVMEAQPETPRSACKVDDVTAGTPPLKVEVKVEVVSPEKVEVFCDSDGAGPDLHNELLISSEVAVEEPAFQTPSENLQAPANGPSIRIELCPQEEEEECWEASSSSANHLLHLHLLVFDHREQRLLQTARSLVRAAVNAAVDQLTREQQRVSSCVQRDHA